MAFFKSTAHLESTMQEMWEVIANDKQMSAKLIESKMVVRFHYKDPEGLVTIDCSDGKVMHVEAGQSKKKPIVEMFMKSEVAHEFWLGKVSVPIAIMTGRIVAKGPVHKALSLLPAITPAFKIYPPIYERHTQQEALKS